MCAATAVTSVKRTPTALEKLRYFFFSQPSDTFHRVRHLPPPHLILPFYTSNLQLNDSEVVACMFGGHATSRLLTKQSGTWLGLCCARWVFDKLYRVTRSAALHSLPVKYSWLLFRHCPALDFENGFRARFPRFRPTVWFSTCKLQARLHTPASPDWTVLVLPHAWD